LQEKVAFVSLPDKHHIWKNFPQKGTKTK